MPKEIEYKFIADIAHDELFGIEDVTRYEQAYISSGDPEVRIRRTMDINKPDLVIPDTYFLAVKAGHGFVREEIEFPIEDQYGDAIFSLVTRPIKKVRLHAGGWEIDLFHGYLNGLVLAESEVPSEMDAVPPIPRWLTLRHDVTYNPAFKNKALYTMSRDDLTQALYHVENKARSLNGREHA